MEINLDRWDVQHALCEVKRARSRKEKEKANARDFEKMMEMSDNSKSDAGSIDRYRVRVMRGRGEAVARIRRGGVDGQRPWQCCRNGQCNFADREP
jgi:hypothetical protein